MKTKLLALGAAFALSFLFASQLRADDETSVTSYLAGSIETADTTTNLGIEDTCCCDDCFRPFWFTGVEMTFMGYNVRTGGRINLSYDDSNTAGVDYSVLDGDNAQGLAFAPRIWLGRQIGEKWGVVGRFWNLTDFTTRAPTLAPGQVELSNFATKTEFDRARLYTIDLEAVRSFAPGNWKIDGSLGARQARIFADAKIDTFGVFTTGNFVNLSLSNGFKFDGIGATGALTFRRQIGDSNASFFFGGRGSHLWGRTDSFGRSAGTIVDNPSTPLSGAATVTRNNAISQLTIAEFQVGIQWDFALESVPMTTFFRTTFEYQNWNVNGPPTGGAGFGGTIGTLTTNSFSRAGLGDASLCGLGVAAGFTW